MKVKADLTVIKEAIMNATMATYERIHGLDSEYETKKPEFLKHLDSAVDQALRPLVT